MKPSSVRRALAASALALSLSACAAVAEADQETSAAAGATAQSASQSATPAQARGPLIANARQLTFEGLRAGEGYFSADGSQMIFQSEREADNPFYQMYLMDLAVRRCAARVSGLRQDHLRLDTSGQEARHLRFHPGRSRRPQEDGRRDRLPQKRTDPALCVGLRSDLRHPGIRSCDGQVCEPHPHARATTPKAPIRRTASASCSPRTARPMGAL